VTEAPELLNDPFLAELTGDLLIVDGEEELGKVYHESKVE